MKHRDRVHRREARRRARESEPYSPSRLYRIPERGVIRGVCAGIAEYFGIDPLFVRVAAVVLLFMFPVAVAIAYLVIARVVPPRPEIPSSTPEEDRFWTGVRTEPDRTLSSLRHRFREMEMRLRAMETFVTSPVFTLGREIDGLKD